MPEGIDNTEQSEAYAQLTRMADELRKVSPWLSADQAFARVIENPKNVELASKAHQRPAATTVFPYAQLENPRGGLASSAPG